MVDANTIRREKAPEGRNLTNARGDTAYHVITAYEVSDAIVDGFTITGGFADEVGSANDRTWGGGADFYQTSVLLENVIFEANHATSTGGGVRIRRGQATFRRVSFRNHDAWGALYVDGPHQMILEEVLFEQNAGTCLVEDDGTLQMDRSRFIGNAHHVVLRKSLSASINNTIFVGATYGAIYLENSAALIVNNSSFSGNCHPFTSAAIWVDGTSEVSFNNSVVWGNESLGLTAKDASLLVESGGSATFRASLLEGWSGAGLISGDNPFGEPGVTHATAPTLGDLHPANGSPLINNGEVNASSGLLDIDGDART